MTLRCPECRSRRATFLSLQAHIKDSGHALCKCGGYHYSHRPNSPCCSENPWSAWNLADRAGATDDDLKDIALEILWSAPGKLGNVCPF